MKSDQARAISLGDLGELTLRANVAFAVRCAQRVRPCFALPADAPRRREQMAAVDGAIRVATTFCQGLPGEFGLATAAARLVFVVAEETGEYTRYAAYAALRAAEAAAQAEKVVRNPSDSGTIEVVAFAFGAGRVLAANADSFSADLVTAALYADVEKLRSLSQGTCADLGPPLDPSDSGPLGPLWPAGTPSWFVAKTGQPPGAIE